MIPPSTVCASVTALSAAALVTLSRGTVERIVSPVSESPHTVSPFSSTSIRVMDQPRLPCSPCGPRGPISPCGPRGPISPCSPRVTPPENPATGATRVKSTSPSGTASNTTGRSFTGTPADCKCLKSARHRIVSGFAPGPPANNCTPGAPRCITTPSLILTVTGTGTTVTMPSPVSTCTPSPSFSNGVKVTCPCTGCTSGTWSKSSPSRWTALTARLTVVNFTGTP